MSAQDYFEHILRFGIKSNKEYGSLGIIPGMIVQGKILVRTP
jgi:hypothetical protein